MRDSIQYERERCVSERERESSFQAGSLPVVERRASPLAAPPKRYSQKVSCSLALPFRPTSRENLEGAGAEPGEKVAVGLPEQVPGLEVPPQVLGVAVQRVQNFEPRARVQLGHHAPARAVPHTHPARGDCAQTTTLPVLKGPTKHQAITGATTRVRVL